MDNMISKNIALTVALLVVLLCMLSPYESDAMPITYTNGGYANYPPEALNYYVPYNEGHLSRLRRGYYYVGDGYVTRVDNPSPLTLERRDLAVRRFDEDVAAKPIQKPKRKKLFVPNLYG